MPAERTCSGSGSVRAEVWLHRDDGRRSSAVLVHLAGRLVLEVHDVSVLRGLNDDASWCSRAAEMTRRGQTVEVRHDGMHLLTLGAGGHGDIRPGSWPTARALLGLLPG